VVLSVRGPFGKDAKYPCSRDDLQERGFGYFSSSLRKLTEATTRKRFISLLEFLTLTVAKKKRNYPTTLSLISHFAFSVLEVASNTVFQLDHPVLKEILCTRSTRTVAETQ